MSASTATIRRPMGQGSIFAAIAVGLASLVAVGAIAWGALNLTATKQATTVQTPIVLDRGGRGDTVPTGPTAVLAGQGRAVHSVRRRQRGQPRRQGRQRDSALRHAGLAFSPHSRQLGRFSWGSNAVPATGAAFVCLAGVQWKGWSGDSPSPMSRRRVASRRAAWRCSGVDRRDIGRPPAMWSRQTGGSRPAQAPSGRNGLDRGRWVVAPDQSSHGTPQAHIPSLQLAGDGQEDAPGRNARVPDRAVTGAGRDAPLLQPPAQRAELQDLRCAVRGTWWSGPWTRGLRSFCR